MKKFILVLSLIALSLFAFAFSACNNSEDVTPVVTGKFEFKTLTVEDNSAYGKVSNSTVEFDFNNEISLPSNGSFVLSLDKQGNEIIDSGKLALNVGDNEVYILQKEDGETVKVYSVNVRRKPVYTVEFFNGEQRFYSHSVEEDGHLSAPADEPTKNGYDFSGWDFNFSNPITDNERITAKWTARTDTGYKIEYYFENVNDNGFSINTALTEGLTGKTDSDITVTPKTFENFTFYAENSVLSGTISAENVLVLKVYYNRNTYNVSYNGNGGVLQSGQESQTLKIGGTENAPTYLRNGYHFDGWTKSVDSVTKDVSYVAKWKDIFVLSNGVITGLTPYGKTLTEILIPEQIDGVTITEIGYMSFFDCDTVRTIEIPDSVITIADHSFYYSDMLSKIVIGKNVESIGENAFQYCYKIVEIINKSNLIIEKGSENHGEIGLYALSVTNKNDVYVNKFITDQNGFVVFVDGEKKILVGYVGSENNLVLPNDITEIYQGAFTNQYNLKTVVLPNSLTKIGDRPFYNCSAIEYSVIGNAKYLGNEQNPYLYLAKVTDDKIESFTVPNGCRFIAHSAFYDCSALTSVEISSSVLEIGAGAFTGCSSLSSIKLPNGLKTIGNNAFMNCYKLISIEIPESVENVGDLAFNACYRLVEVANRSNCITASNVDGEGLYRFPFALNIVNGNETFVSKISIDSDGFVVFTDGDDKILVSYVGDKTEIILPSDITAINKYAFLGLSSIVSVEIPKSVTEIGFYGFKDCSSLQTIKFTGSVAEWNVITKGLSWKYGVIATEINCSDGNAQL